MIPRQRIVSSFEEIKNLPTFPQVAKKIMDKIEDPDSSASDIARVIKYDPACSAAILKAANSVYYNPSGKPVGNVQLAIARLGMNEVGKISIAFSAMRIFTSSSELISLREFWKHSISVAMSTKAIITLLGKGRDEQNDAFTAGLFHDVGIMIFDQYFFDDYRKLRNENETNELNIYENEQNMLGIDHGELGAMLLRRWRFPEFICEVITFHHEPDKCGAEHKRLCQIIHLTDFAVSSSGIFEPGEGIPKGSSESAWHDLGLNTKDMESIVKEVEQSAECAKIYALFGLK